MIGSTDERKREGWRGGREGEGELFTLSTEGVAGAAELPEAAEEGSRWCFGSCSRCCRPANARREGCQLWFRRVSIQERKEKTHVVSSRSSSARLPLNSVSLLLLVREVLLTVLSSLSDASVAGLPLNSSSLSRSVGSVASSEAGGVVSVVRGRVLRVLVAVGSVGILALRRVAVGIGRGRVGRVGGGEVVGWDPGEGSRAVGVGGIVVIETGDD